MYKMILIILFIVAVVLPSNAEQDKIIAGPYTVYLDTNIYLDKIIESYGTDLSFRWDLYKKESETLDGKDFTQYSLLSKAISDTYSDINSEYDSYYILIRITETNSESHSESNLAYNYTYPSEELSVEKVIEAVEGRNISNSWQPSKELAVRRELEQANCNDIQVYSRTIDDYNAAIGEGLDSITADKTYTAIWYIDDTTECLISSNIPWDEGTRQLINSIHINLGESYLIDKAESLRVYDKKYDEAIQILNKVIKINPQNGNAWFKKGWILFYDYGTDKKADAIQAFDQFIEIEQNSEYPSILGLRQAWGTKGMAFARLDRYDEAIQAFDKAIEIDPKSSFTWWMKGEALYYQGKYDDAIQACDKSLELNPEPNPNHANTLRLKGRALEALGRTTEADVAFATAKEVEEGASSVAAVLMEDPVIVPYS